MVSDFQYKEIRPNSELDGYVECFWICEGNIPGGESMKEVLVPGGRTEIIYSNVPVTWHGPEKTENLSVLPGMILLGQRDKVSYLEVNENFRFFGIRFKYGCLPLFLTGSASEYSNRIFNTTGFSELESSLCFTENVDVTNPEFIRNAERYLLNLLSQPDQDWLVLQEIIRSLYEMDWEPVSVQLLAKKHGWNYKKIERVFLKYLGFPPSVFIKIVRFRNAIEGIKEGEEALTQSAQRFGYYDQSHFIKEFHRYTGVNPSFFLKETPLMAKHLYRFRREV